ncbi:RsmB/NOP family class I SAM-dependent RNA methyltransferase [Luteolibacter sp. GHJ8]|uniref:RsmB/NOP family class I SAM-dependent RNA methyltransferase n=1 Tax=Luteolibacter rhizosphaerae TaxID=2989719 RepID=A0ABT3G9X1_9BACT|nr:RsmB/NOP family class I SAM-dependent RNA methyltransferase [Luteolibacter rhizosphaerae]MCW1916643.1 RsmB/NOP family class I SAM-dependent RNA methyltransferase [Luteolibacter rhizosphaerae]
MRIHRTLAEGCAGILREVFDQGRVLDRILEQVFRANPKWGKRDRGFIAETVFEVTRWRRALAFVAGSETLQALCAAQWNRAGLEVPEWWVWEGYRIPEMTAREELLGSEPRAIHESIPDWLDQRASEELGEEWDPQLTALNRRAPVFLRVNRLRLTPTEAIGWLLENGVESALVHGVPDALVLPDGRSLPKGLAGEGLVEIQDAGSQTIAPLLDVEPGMRVVDACAGAGGKTLHLAALMQGRGEIVAMDVSAAKLSELRRRAARAGTRIIRTETWREDTLKRYAGWADRVLIDAPCSGLGTLRRQPDLKWRLSEGALEKTRRLQRRLLDHYPGLLRPGGKFVYATCSVLPSENEGQIELLRERDGRFAVEEIRKTSPAGSGWDGFFAARLAVP